MSLIALAANKTAEAVTAALVASLRPLSNRVYTLTYDNGKEFAHHKTVAEALNAEGFFAHPYHSWERGLNENTNGLLRQYFPKGINLSEVHQNRLNAVARRLNERPRKTPDYETPAERFGQCVASIA